MTPEQLAELKAEIVEKLWDATFQGAFATLTQAKACKDRYAQVIEPLIAEHEKALEALKPFAEEASRYEPDEGDENDTAWDSDFTVGDLRRAADVKG